MSEDSVTLLEAKLQRAAELKDIIAKLEPAKKELDAIRADLDTVMAQNQSKRSEPVSGYYALVVETKSLNIVDEQTLADWLEENTLDSEAYYTRKIDPKAITKLQEERMDSDGEILPGVQEVVTRRVDIRKAGK